MIQTVLSCAQLSAQGGDHVDRAGCAALQNGQSAGGAAQAADVNGQSIGNQRLNGSAGSDDVAHNQLIIAVGGVANLELEVSGNVGAGREQLLAVEVGAVSNALDFGLQSLNLILQGGTVHIIVIDAVGGLLGQVNHAVEHILNFLQSALSGLDQAGSVLGVLLSGFQTLDLGAHLLGNGQTGGIVASAVDLVAGRQLLQVLAEHGGVVVVVPVGVHGHNIVLNTHNFLSLKLSVAFRFSQRSSLGLRRCARPT